MLNPIETVSRKREREQENLTNMLLAITEVIDDQVALERETKEKKTQGTYTKKTDNSLGQDRAVRQMLQIVGINDAYECSDRLSERETIPNPKLVVLYYALVKCVNDHNINAQEKIDLYSPIKKPSKDLLEATKKSSDIVFNPRLGLFAIKPGHSLPIYVDNPDYISIKRLSIG